MSTYERIEILDEDYSMVIALECITCLQRTNMVRIGTSKIGDPADNPAQWNVCVRPPDESVYCVAVDSGSGRVRIGSRNKTIYHLILDGNLNMLRDNPFGRTTQPEPPVSAGQDK
ncbi:MAG: hypothetical protein ACLQVD_17845 [Capsulimonadaceae bacterium]